MVRLNFIATCCVYILVVLNVDVLVGSRAAIVIVMAAVADIACRHDSTTFIARTVSSNKATAPMASTLLLIVLQRPTGASAATGRMDLAEFEAELSEADKRLLLATFSIIERATGLSIIVIGLLLFKPDVSLF